MEKNAYTDIVECWGPVDFIVRADARVLSLQGEGEWGHVEGQDVGRLLNLPAVQQTVH